MAQQKPTPQQKSPPTSPDRLLDQFMIWAGIVRGRSDQTVALYMTYLRRLVAFMSQTPKGYELEGRSLQTATAGDLEAYVGRYSHERGISPRARRVVVASVRLFYTWLQKVEQIQTNPAKHLPYPKAGTALPKAIQLADAEKMIMTPGVDTFLGLRDTCILLCLAGCGMRVSGVVALNESSLIWYQSEKSGTKRLAIKVREKGSNERLVPAPVELSTLLLAYLAHPELAEINRDLDEGDRVLFVSTHNSHVSACDYHGERRRLTTRGIRVRLDYHASKAGLSGPTNPHSWRHLFGTEMAEDDVDLLRRSALMGHQDPKATGVYTHLAMRKLTATIDGAGPLAKMDNQLLRDLRQLARQ